MKYLRAILLVLLFIAPVRGQEILRQEALLEKPIQRKHFLIRPFYDKPVALLSAIQVGAVSWDNVTTRMSEKQGNVELNPLMRPFAHNSASLVAVGVGEVWLSAFVAERMKRSNNIILRKAWWVPQVFNISLGFGAGVRNTIVLTH